MPKVVIIARVKDPVRWEERFRTHRDLFRGSSITGSIDFGTIEDNQVAICFEPDDLKSWWASMGSPENEAAVDFDGVERETVRIFVLEKEVRL